jgi:ferredoxin
LGKHGGLLHRNAPSWVGLYYRRYATSEVEEEPIVLQVSEPEKIVKIRKKVVLLYPPYCDRCGTCVSVCHKKALKIRNERLRINTELCVGCGLCVKKCPKEVLGLQEEKVDTGKKTEEIAIIETLPDRLIS